MFEPCAAGGYRVKHRQCRRLEFRLLDIFELGQLDIAQNRRFGRDLPAAVRLRVDQVFLRTDAAGRISKHFLANSVYRRIGDLGEKLLEIVV